MHKSCSSVLPEYPAVQHNIYLKGKSDHCYFQYSVDLAGLHLLARLDNYSVCFCGGFLTLTNSFIYDTFTCLDNSKF